MSDILRYKGTSLAEIRMRKCEFENKLAEMFRGIADSIKN
jgi:hypothetical protein